MNTYLYGASFLLGLVLAYFAIKQLQITRRIISTGVKTVAEVIGFNSIIGGETKMFEPIYEYVDLSGVKKQHVSDIQYAKPPMKIGDKMQVYYNDKGEFKMSSYWGLYRWTIILLTFATPFLIIGGGYLLYTRT